jgi:hypothetical protein
MVVFNTECSDAVDRGLLVDEQDFTEARVETLAREFLRDHGADKVISFLVGVDQHQILSSHHGEAHITDSSAADQYSDVAKELEKRKKLTMPAGPLARLIAIRGTALLSIKKNGVITERVIGGESDPTNFEESGIQYKLLHLNLSAGGEAIRGYCELKVFLQTRSRFSVSGLVALTRRLQALTGVADVVSIVRPDSWFIGDAAFPYIPPFSADLKLPDPLQWVLSPGLSCRFKGGRPVCSGQNFEP